ncbi:MAG: hypothetical protein J5925_05890 [Clostridia bacterium]|nr:hypothetical protein [Clostridia bacterium]
MKKTLSVIALMLVALMLVPALVSCGSNGDFVGTWEEVDENGESKGETLTLANDGTGSVSSSGVSGSVKWDVSGDKITLTVSLCGMTETNEYTYEFSGDNLILTDAEGGKTIYKKK